MNYDKAPESWARVSPEVVMTGSDAAIRNVLTMAVKDIARLSAQLQRANKLIGWMMPYIGTMCPPSNGLADLNEHCCDNIIRPRMDDETKGPSIRQRSRGARPDGIPTR